MGLQLRGILGEGDGHARQRPAELRRVNSDVGAIARAHAPDILVRAHEGAVGPLVDEDSGISRNGERCGRNELKLRLGQGQRDNAGGVFVPCRALGVAAWPARPDDPERDRRVGDADPQVAEIVDRSARGRSREGVAEVEEETARLCVDDCGTEVDPAQRREKVTPRSGVGHELPADHQMLGFAARRRTDGASDPARHEIRRREIHVHAVDVELDRKQAVFGGLAKRGQKWGRRDVGPLQIPQNGLIGCARADVAPARAGGAVPDVDEGCGVEIATHQGVAACAGDPDPQTPDFRDELLFAVEIDELRAYAAIGIGHDAPQRRIALRRAPGWQPCRSDPAAAQPERRVAFRIEPAVRRLHVRSLHFLIVGTERSVVEMRGVVVDG